MKKSLLCLLALLLAVALTAGEIQKATNLKKVAEANVVYKQQAQDRDIPAWSWHVTPTALVNSLYDYSPGSYSSTPIRLQETGGGIYMAYHGQENATAQRRIFYSYIDANGAITTALVTNTDIREGYPGIDVDPETGDPFVAWHAGVNGAANLDVVLSYDQFDILGTPGLWISPYVVWANPDEDEFIWPYVFIIPSPVEGMRRIFIEGSNATSNAAGHPAENAQLAYADFSSPADLASYNADDWTVFTIPQLDDWHNGDIRPFKAMAHSENVVAFIGHTSNLADGAPAYDVNDRLFILYNTNYGEGEWIVNTFDPTIPVTNPDGYFESDTGAAYTDMRYNPYVSGHHNAIIDAQGNVGFVAFCTLSTEESTWYPFMTTAKYVKFNLTTQEWTINDLHPFNEDGSRYIPWDNPPQYDPESGNLLTNGSWPCFWWNSDDVFNEQYFKTGHNSNWLVSVFSEGIKSKYYNDGGDDTYAQWAEAPELYVTLSADYGTTWTEAISLNNIEVPEMADVIAEYVYVADDIEVIDETHGRIHLMFFDDASYGSSVQGYGSLTAGGTVDYAAIDVEFPAPWVDPNDAADDNNVVVSTIKAKNYPNPFNPNTTIAYSVEKDAQVNVAVYNLKGQVVKTLVNEMVTAGDHTITWNGNNENNETVSSGIYFYKVTVGNNVEMKKMVMMK